MWKEYLEKHLYKPTQGCFELPYLSNSPGKMVESVSSIPGCYHDKRASILSADNPFISGMMRYLLLDDGLALFASDIKVHRDLLSKALYEPEVTSDYYFLNFSVFEYRFPTGHGRSDFAVFISKTCTFYKPHTLVHTYFYQNTEGSFYNIAFTREWLEKNITLKNQGAKEIVFKYLDGKSGFINWLDIVHDSSHLSEMISNELNKSGDDAIRKERVRHILATVISDFFNIMIAEGELIRHKSLANSDYAKVAAAEKVILGTLTSGFPGVEEIAAMVHVSATKLKSDFKKVFGFSMLQYQKEKNMLLSMQLLKKTEMQVKNIAAFCGYQSLSKFTAAFKKRFDLIPSALRNANVSK